MKIDVKRKTTRCERQGEGKSRKRTLIMAGLAILLVGLAAKALRSNPVDAARQLRAQLSQDEDLSPEERQELGQKLRDQVRSLAPEQRRELMADRQKEMAKEMEQFFQLTAREQQQELDKKTDQMVVRMQNGGPRGGPNAGPNGPGFGGPGAFGTNPGQGGNLGAADGPKPFAGKGASPQQREERRQQMLDYSTPAFRAQMFEFRQMMQNRMHERGLQLPAFGAKRP